MTTDDERRRDRTRLIEEMRERLLDVPASVQLARLHVFMTRCWKCGATTAFDAEVCESCGNELMEYGKH